jgi:hypothetical protein
MINHLVSGDDGKCIPAAATGKRFVMDNSRYKMKSIPEVPVSVAFSWFVNNPYFYRRLLA